MKTEFVLVDFENVQPKNVSLLSGGPFKIKVFLGTNQAKIPLEMARALQAFGPDAEYIQIDGSGSNALDFHIAYYIGRLSAEVPGARFYVISKDTGFDPLIRHLAAKKISCQRSKSLAEIPQARLPKSGSAPDKVDAVIENLARRKASRPRTLKTLRSSIRAHFANQLGDAEIDGLIEQLTSRGAIKVADGKVHYEPQS
ncbi:MAG: PIN domain-containing protein [Acidobacteriota bacterium]